MLRRLWLKLVRRRRLHDDLEAELASHRDMARQAGNPVPFGHPGVIRELALDLWRFTFVENLWRDIRYGARGLLRAPVLLFSALPLSAWASVPTRPCFRWRRSSC
jgi:hypothetical protein